MKLADANECAKLQMDIEASTHDAVQQLKARVEQLERKPLSGETAEDIDKCAIELHDILNTALQSCKDAMAATVNSRRTPYKTRKKKANLRSVRAARNMARNISRRDIENREEQQQTIDMAKLADMMRKRAAAEQINQRDNQASMPGATQTSEQNEDSDTDDDDAIEQREHNNLDQTAEESLADIHEAAESIHAWAKNRRTLTT